MSERIEVPVEVGNENLDVHVGKLVELPALGSILSDRYLKLQSDVLWRDATLRSSTKWHNLVSVCVTNVPA